MRKRDALDYAFVVGMWLPPTLVLLIGGMIGCVASQAPATLEERVSVLEAKVHELEEGGDPPSPVPSGHWEKLMHDASVRYLHAKAATLRSLLESGPFNSPKDVTDWLNSHWPSEKDAFIPVNEAWKAEFEDGDWTWERHAAIVRKQIDAYEGFEMNGLGWLRESAESRSILHSRAMTFRLAHEFAAPPEIDHRPWLEAYIENQGPIGSCVGHGSSGISEVLHYLDTKGGIIQFSRMAAYKWAQQQDGINGAQSGAMVSGALKASKSIGNCEEELLPYDANRYDAPIPKQCLEDAAKHKVIGQHAILRSYQECFDWLASGAGVVIIGIPWYESFAETRGLITQAQGRKLGGHCIIWQGYTTRKDPQGRQYIDSKNSHGREWGQGGFAEWAPSVVQQMCEGINRGGNEIIGVTDIMDEKLSRAASTG